MIIIVVAYYNRESKQNERLLRECLLIGGMLDAVGKFDKFRLLSKLGK